jgi:hypothetical protein
MIQGHDITGIIKDVIRIFSGRNNKTAEEMRELRDTRCLSEVVVYRRRRTSASNVGLKQGIKNSKHVMPMILKDT